ncbi:hypothetical protein JCM5296_003532 [Sporobolomyces johnsonii]
MDLTKGGLARSPPRPSGSANLPDTLLDRALYRPPESSPSLSASQQQSLSDTGRKGKRTRELVEEPQPQLEDGATAQNDGLFHQAPRFGAQRKRHFMPGTAPALPKQQTDSSLMLPPIGRLSKTPSRSPAPPPQQDTASQHEEGLSPPPSKQHRTSTSRSPSSRSFDSPHHFDSLDFQPNLSSSPVHNRPGLFGWDESEPNSSPGVQNEVMGGEAWRVGDASYHDGEQDTEDKLDTGDLSQERRMRTGFDADSDHFAGTMQADEMQDEVEEDFDEGHAWEKDHVGERDGADDLSPAGRPSNSLPTSSQPEQHESHSPFLHQPAFHQASSPKSDAFDIDPLDPIPSLYAGGNAFLQHAKALAAARSGTNANSSHRSPKTVEEIKERMQQEADELEKKFGQSRKKVQDVVECKLTRYSKSQADLDTHAAKRDETQKKLIESQKALVKWSEQLFGAGLTGENSGGGGAV